MTVITDAVVAALKRQKLVNGGDGRGIAGADPQLPSAWCAVGDVGDVGPAGLHDAGSRDFTSVNESGKVEVALRESGRDLLHVGTDPGPTGGIGRITPERDAAAIRQ